jgi:hypothetical protein
MFQEYEGVYIDSSDPSSWMVDAIDYQDELEAITAVELSISEEVEQ